MDDQACDLVDGASKLVEFVGYWPSFHDAALESILIERQGPTVTILFRINEAAPEGEDRRDRRAKVRMRWCDVEDLTFSGIDWDENNWIDGLTVTPNGESTRTTIAKMHGTHGFIVARRIEVLGVDPIISPDYSPRA